MENTQNTPAPKFKTGDIVSLVDSILHHPVVVANPDPFGQIVVADNDGEYLVRSQDRCQLVPSFPVGFVNIYPDDGYPAPLGVRHPTRGVADTYAAADKGRLGVYEFHADGTVTLHEVDQ